MDETGSRSVETRFGETDIVCIALVSQLSSLVSRLFEVPMSILIPTREPYPSDISDEQWSRVAPLIPEERPGGRHRETDPREIVNAVHYRWSVGCAWRMLPHDFPPWTTIYTHFHRWQQDGTLLRLREELLRPKLRRRSAPMPHVPSEKASDDSTTKASFSDPTATASSAKNIETDRSDQMNPHDERTEPPKEAAA